MNTVHSKIPEGWKVCKFKEVVSNFKNGGTPSTKVKSYWEGNIPWITGADIVDGRVATFRKFISQEGVKNSATNIIPKGNLLLVTRTGVGKVAIAPTDIAISQDLTGIILSEEIIPQYAYWYFLKNAAVLKSLNQGTSINGIIRADLEDITFIFPDKRQQQKIDDVLTTVNEVIKETDNIIVVCEKIKSWLLGNVFAKGLLERSVDLKDKNIDNAPTHWNVIELEKVAIVIMGQSPASQDCNKYQEGLPFFQGNAEFGDIYPKPQVYCSKPTKISEPGDILVSVRAPVGDININNTEACIGRGISAIRPKKIDLFYLFYYLKTCIKYFERVQQGSTFKAINSDDIKKLLVPLPSEKEQKKIAAILYQIDLRLESEKQKKAQLETLKKGLMQVLLTGEIRVIRG